jgi:hypothetical protein
VTVFKYKTDISAFKKKELKAGYKFFVYGE